MTRAELLRTLRATPDRIEALARGLSRGQLARRPAAAEWSMGQILAHLLLGERDVILPRWRRMRLEDHPVFPSSAPGRRGFAAKARAGDFAADLVAFRRTRAATLAFLDALDDRAWQRLGTSPTRGTLTLEGYAGYLAEHDLEHLAQLRTTRARV